MSKQYSQIDLFIRSLIFVTYSTLGIFLYSFVCIFSMILPLRYRHALIRGFLTSNIWMLKTTCRVNYRVEGLENIPKDHAAIVMSKHQSTWETFFLPQIFHDPAVIIKRELLWVPFFGWGLLVSDPISINRKDKSSAMQQLITKGKKCLDEGRFVLVFPEGTRVPSGQVGHYRLGGARLAVATEHGVIPVAHNAGRAWARRTFIKHPGTITVVVGAEISTIGKTAEEVLAETKAWIETTMLRIDPTF